ncbi:MAG: hypothetical protein US57_C0005G0057 [Candidatus Moranbacteria bacterium GW2011_GWC2_37_73]|nr:MAG: hypothetical protein UR95_C0001G0162 [Parcubacteria group bacterium GW2011_GWC1_36_108]KKQ00547.1 MAG: hypothetical protein US10_C0030G0006 [Candidatus Moranbacteria bacterium GW2011_GWD2_36_198]KKQ01165.1 MAG: hypothetical protein US09_C0002G0003 [Candidatus Moranbacteria bacterium GW2011_GWD1_36_198]KKQ40101.1 MAG: hypothetical protein US57_C0005G0057 [Candidatus Moranbacteria bacterium GW2011_GWC2_37_73]HAR99571.1 hypothetical protein [Candidatus Moranbacteria bacterium]
MKYKLTQQTVICLDEILESIKMRTISAKQREWLKEKIKEIKEGQFSVADYEQKLNKILTSMHRQVEISYSHNSNHCETFAFLHMKLLHIFENRFFIEKK